MRLGAIDATEHEQWLELAPATVHECLLDRLLAAGVIAGREPGAREPGPGHPVLRVGLDGLLRIDDRLLQRVESRERGRAVFDRRRGSLGERTGPSDPRDAQSGDQEQREKESTSQVELRNHFVAIAARKLGPAFSTAPMSALSGTEREHTTIARSWCNRTSAVDTPGTAARLPFTVAAQPEQVMPEISSVTIRSLERAASF